MPAKIIIAAPGRPNVNGHKRRSFQWNPTFNCYVWENKELTESEFNAAAEAVFKKNYDLKPFARIVAFSDGSATAPEAPASEYEKLAAKYKALQSRIGEAAPVATISAREVGLDEAIEIVQRLAPEKLRKTSQGRKPNAPQMLEVG